MACSIFSDWDGPGWMSITAIHDREWRALCGAIERPELADDERFADAASRYRNEVPLNAELRPAERFPVEVKGHPMRGIYLKPRRFPVNDIRTLFRLRQRGKQRGQQAVTRENPQL